MKTAARRKPKPPASFEKQYRAALRECTEHPDEAALGRAYELGRNAIAEGRSLLDIASLHYQALQEIVSSANGSKLPEELLRAGADFLAESLSPYEMARRGFQDAVGALRRLNETLEEEIKRIAYAVHDEAGQSLVAVHLALAELASTLPKSQHPRLAQMDKLLNQVESQLRHLSHELRPTVLDDLGWLPAIRFLADRVSKRSGIPIRVRSKIKGRLPSSHETALYRIVQEALTNAMKHAKASFVRIEVHKENRNLCCSIQDDGIGFDPSDLASNRKREGLGLIGIRERLNALGGTLSLNSVPGGGTTISIRFPMEVPNAH